MTETTTATATCTFFYELTNIYQSAGSQIITAYEAYKVSPSDQSLLTNVIGWFQGTSGFNKSSDLEFYERRSDLGGYHFKYAFVETEGYNTLDPNNNTRMTGT
jgi:hypothetical protein